MRLVLDTNILLSALISDSASRGPIFKGQHQFYYPEEGLKEIERYEHLVLKKTSLNEGELDSLIRSLFSKIELVDLSHFSGCVSEANRIMAGIDPNDMVFLALAMSIPSCAIWSNDKHLKKQNLVRVYTKRDSEGLVDPRKQLLLRASLISLKPIALADSIQPP